MKRYAFLFDDGEAFLMKPAATLAEARAELAKIQHDQDHADLVEVDCIVLRLVPTEEKP